jgi:hypothetical protein
MIKSRRTGHIAQMKGKSAYKDLCGKPEGEKPLEGPKRRWEYNIKMNLD